MKPLFLLVLCLAIVLSGCGSFSGSSETSRTTGWEYNSEETGMPYVPDYEQPAGPGLVFVQGGTFVMGRVDEDILYKWDNEPRRVTVASFYMDETEISNQAYREYIYWLERVYPGDRQKVATALPDTNVWRSDYSYNEPYVNNYFRHVGYSDYPVVGVSWEQANEYSSWRTDRVNEKRLIDNGILQFDDSQSGQDVFTTETYLAGLYEGVPGRREQMGGKDAGIILPEYRLPTEAEWEYAAYGLIGNSDGELLTDRRLYPWDGAYLRNDSKKERGQMRANFARGRGDLMGMAGALNDNATIAAPIFSYEPNDFGLYCMAGNVNEWVADVYHPTAHIEVNEFQPYRGGAVTEYRRGPDGELIRNEYGELIKDTVVNIRAENLVEPGQPGGIVPDLDVLAPGQVGQENNASTFSAVFDDEVRVYKGGSWKDRAYWLNPGTRRFLEQSRAQNDLGFRCVMLHTGNQKGS